MSLDTKIKKYLLGLDPKLLGLNSKLKKRRIKVSGVGESNLNYLAVLDGKRFVFRINMDPKISNKSRKEFIALKNIEYLKIAPRALLLDDSRKVINESFIVLEYLPGSPLYKHLKKLNRNTTEKLATIVAKLHLIPIGKLKLNTDRPTYTSWLIDIEVEVILLSFANGCL